MSSVRPQPRETAVPPAEDPRSETNAGDRPAARVAIFLLSAGVLLLEIAYTRIFSFSLWYHFTYVALSVALLGYGASGAILAASGRLAAVPPERLFARAILVAISGVLVSLLTIIFVPIKPFAVREEPVQFFLTFLFLVLCSTPFFGAGLAKACAFRVTRSPNGVYFADLTGASIGCIAALGAIWVLGAPGAAVASAVVFLVACLLAAPADERRRLAAMAAGAITISAVVVALVPFRPSPDKFLAKVIQAGGTVYFSRWSPIFRVDVYDPPPIRTIAARGVSPRFTGQLPLTRFISHDATAEAPMHEFHGDMAELDFLAHNVSAAPYVVAQQPPRVLVIGLGGGFDVLNAIRNGAAHTTGIELDPITVDVVRTQQADFVGHILSRPDVDVVVAEGRSFLRHTMERWDVIQLTGVDTLAALSTGGAYMLAESYLYTVDAFGEYLDHLTPDGTLSLMIGDSTWNTGQARFSLRHVMNFIEAAKRRGIADPAAHTVIVAQRQGGISMIELMFKPRPFTATEVERVRKVVADDGFEALHLPGVESVTPQSRLLRATPAERDRLLAAMPLKVEAITDNQPFFFHFHRWRALLHPKSWEIDVGHAGLTGQMVLASVLVASVLASVLLILVPLAITPRLRRPGRLRFATYFSALGLGFMLVEVSTIQKCVLFLGHPTYAVAIILFALLVWTGLGSHLSGRLTTPPRTVIRGALMVLLLLLPVYGWLAPALFERWLGASASFRHAVTVVLLLPLGLTLGVFFPAGLRAVREADELLVPWAWGANGGASVIGSILAIMLAMAFGFRVVLVIAGLVYLTGVLALEGTAPRPTEAPPPAA